MASLLIFYWSASALPRFNHCSSVLVQCFDVCEDPYRDFAKRQLYERVAALEGPSRRIPAGPLKGCRERTRYSSWLGLIDSIPLSCHKIGIDWAYPNIKWRDYQMNLPGAVKTALILHSITHCYVFDWFIFFDRYIYIQHICCLFIPQIAISLRSYMDKGAGRYWASIEHVNDVMMIFNSLGSCDNIWQILSTASVRNLGKRRAGEELCQTSALLRDWSTGTTSR